MGGRHWTEQEDAALRSFWHAGGTIESHLHLLPGRSKESATSRADKLRLGTRHGPFVLWTAEEDAILRQIWATKGSLKSRLHLLPGRSWRAALVRAATIGLKGRDPKHRADCYSWVEQEIDRILSNGGALTVRQIADRTTASYVAVQQALRRQRSKKYHVEGWTRTRVTGTGSWWPKWAIGADEDVPKPKSKPHAQVAREWRAKKKIKEGEFNPFAIAMNQVIREAA
jgi:hypothetical protein